MVDFKGLYLKNKIDALRNGQNLEKLKLDSLAKIMFKTMDMFGRDIDKHIGL